MTNRNLFEARDLLKEKLGDIPLEEAPVIADTFFGMGWPAERSYDIDNNPEVFERLHRDLVGTWVTLTPETFVRYITYLERIRKDVLTYFDGKVPQKEFDDFYDSQPHLWWIWGDLMRGNEGDEFYHVREPYEFATDFMHGAHALYQDEIKRIHRNEKLEFLLSSEVSINKRVYRALF
jgi:hypothetical protein